MFLCVCVYIYIYIYIYIYKGCLKKDATHKYDNDLLLRLAQWWSFETCPVKNASFELKTSDQWFINCYYISFQDMQSLFEFLVSVINHYHINWLYLFGDSFEWFCLQIIVRQTIFRLLSQALWSRISSYYSIPFSNLKQNRTLVSVCISEMRYYVHYLHFSDYCPHFCRYVYPNVPAVVRSGLLHMRHSNHLQKAGAYNGRSVVINMATKMRTIIRKT